MFYHFVSFVVVWTFHDLTTIAMPPPATLSRFKPNPNIRDSIYSNDILRSPQELTIETDFPKSRPIDTNTLLNPDFRPIIRIGSRDQLRRLEAFLIESPTAKDVSQPINSLSEGVLLDSRRSLGESKLKVLTDVRKEPKIEYNTAEKDATSSMKFKDGQDVMKKEIAEFLERNKIPPVPHQGFNNPDQIQETMNKVAGEMGICLNTPEWKRECEDVMKTFLDLTPAYEKYPNADAESFGELLRTIDTWLTNKRRRKESDVRSLGIVPESPESVISDKSSVRGMRPMSSHDSPSSASGDSSRLSSYDTVYSNDFKRKISPQVGSLK